VKDAGALETPSPPDRVWQKVLKGLEQAERKERTKEARAGGFLSLLFMPGFRYAAGAALVLFLVGGGVWIGLRMGRTAGGPAGGYGQKFTLAKLDEAERHYQLAIQALNEALSAQKESFDPRLVAAFQKNLEVIDTSIDVCRQAVVQNPEDIGARDYLLAAYQGKLDFLNNEMEMRKVSRAPGGAETSL
jgi:hypothetical protein